MKSSYEFNYTVDELREAWKIKSESLSVVFAVIQWAKKRDLLDDVDAILMMESVLGNLEKIYEKDFKEFDELLKEFEKGWVNLIPSLK